MSYVYVNDAEKYKEWECNECDHIGMVATHRQEKQGDKPLQEYLECPACKLGFWTVTVTWSNGGEE